MGGGIISSQNVTVPKQVIVPELVNPVETHKEIGQPFLKFDKKSIQMRSLHVGYKPVQSNYFRNIRYGQRRESWKQPTSLF